MTQNQADPPHPAPNPTPNQPPYENPSHRVIALDEIVSELANLGLSPTSIARATSSTVEEVQSLILRGSLSDAVEEKRLEDDFRRLMQTAVNQAFQIMQFGASEQKMRIITAMLSNTGKAVGKDARNPNENIRTAFNELMEEMRGPRPKAITAATDDRY